MAELTEKEVSCIVDIISNYQVTISKLNSYKTQCNSPKVNQLFKERIDLSTKNISSLFQMLK